MSEKVQVAVQERGAYDPSVMPADFKGRQLGCLMRAHSDQIVMQRSRFGPERPDTVFFQYPGFVGRERERVNTYVITQ